MTVRRFGLVPGFRLQSIRLWLLYTLFFNVGATQATIVPLLPTLAHRYGLSGSETGLILALPSISTLVVSMPAGAVADRFGASRVTLVAATLLCMSSLAQAVPSIGVLIVGRIAFGVAFGFIWTTGPCLGRRDLGAEHLRSARAGGDALSRSGS